MALTVHGTSRSRAFRVLWMLEELGLAYAHEPIAWQDCARNPEYLAINPAGSIPCLVEDGFVLSESLAINLHLARTRGRLLPDGPHGQSLALQWSLWVATSIEDPYTRWALQARWRGIERRDPEKLAAALRALERPLGRLAKGLAGREWLVGEAFSVADLNVAATIALLRSGEPVVPDVVVDWLARCCARDAYARAAARP